jgi:hypothetical protein
MSSKLDKPNHFLNPEIRIPSQASCAPIFNKIFQEGNSFNDFESYIKSKAVSEAQMSHPQFTSAIQYNLKQDIWGIKEGVMILKGGNSDMDVVITYVIRDANEWTHLVNFFEDKFNAVEIENKPGHRVYQYRIYLKSNDTREILFHVLRDSPQSSRMSLMLKF